MFWQGTSLPNAQTVYLADGTVEKAYGGVYLWPNGWVTLYPDAQNVNRGRVYPPHAIDHIEFGATK